MIVTPETLDEGSRIIGEVSGRLREAFGIGHVTLQLEKETLEKLQGAKPD